MVDNTRTLVNGIDAELLRDNQALRESIRQDFEQVRLEVDQAITDLPRRRIHLEAA